MSTFFIIFNFGGSYVGIPSIVKVLEIFLCTVLLDRWFIYLDSGAGLSCVVREAVLSGDVKLQIDSCHGGIHIASVVHTDRVGAGGDRHFEAGQSFSRKTSSF